MPHPTKLISNLIALCLLLALTACGGETETTTESDDAMTTAPAPGTDPADSVAIHPVIHGSVALTRGDLTILVDPYDGSSRYTGFGAPDLVFITHTHGDHLDSATLAGLNLSEATLVAPQSVMDAMPASITFADRHTMANGDTWAWEDVDATAVAAYNLPPSEDAFHPPGKFNGYVIDVGGVRHYFSGDTEDVPEMRALEDIDVAFVCMNQPYTMEMAAAADAVLEFKPEVVYPYHYRNQGGEFMDVSEFARMVEAGDASISVRLAEWY